MTVQEIVLPPVYRLVTLREVGDAFAHAKAHASKDGAGTLVFVGRFGLVEFALVLEPDEPLRQARRAFYAGMSALADALAVNAPPEKPMNIDWPDAIRVDTGLVGGGRLAWPDGADENEPPEWLVFGAMIRTVSMMEGDPGLRPLATTLEEEGFDGVTDVELVEAFSRHFMSAIDAWQEEGFDAVAHEYLSRLPAETGVRRAIDENGDLLIQRAGKTGIERRELVPILRESSWYDPKSRGPRA